MSSAAFNGEFDDPGYSLYGLGLPVPTVFAQALEVYRSELDARCLALATSRGLGTEACTPGAATYETATAQPPVGWGVRTLIAKNRLDQNPMNDYFIPIVSECDADGLAAREAWLAGVDAALTNVAWLYAPADPQETVDDANLHGLFDQKVWAYQPPGFGGASFRDLVTAFWRARTLDARAYRMVYAGAVPHGAGSE